MEDTYKSVLLANNTTDTQLTLFIYLSGDPLCWFSYLSKIVPPGDKYLHRESDRFKFSIEAIDAANKKSTIVPVQRWRANKYFDVSVGQKLEVTESDLANHPQEKQICIRRINKEKELADGNGKNLYELLKLNMADVRKKSREEQNEMIKKAFHREIRRWHPDHNPDMADDRIACEVIVAYDVLRDPERRTEYHRMADYDSGWTKSRWRAVFWPECETKEQKQAYRRRMWQIGLSVGLTLGGIALSVATAGLATPWLVVAGGIIGGGLTGAGIQGGQRTIKRSSIEDGCEWTTYSKSAGLGCVSGMLVGGAAVGITAGVAGIGTAALEAAKVTTVQYIAIGGGTGAVGGIISSLSGDADKKIVDKQDVTLKQVAGHALCGAMVGGAAGILGGVATKAVAGRNVAASAANLEGEAAEQVIIRTGGRKLGDMLARNVSRAVVEGGVGAVVESPLQFVEERLDDSVENRPPGDHVIDAAKNIATDVFKEGGTSFASTLGSHTWSEIKVRRNASKTLKGSSIKYSSLSHEEKQLYKHNERQKLDEKNHSKYVNWNSCKGSRKYSMLEKQNLDEIPDDIRQVINASASENPLPRNGRIRYLSEGDWWSKMIVKYELHGKPFTEEITGSGESVELPAEALNITVRFQVMRFISTWCDIKKYDRFSKQWIEPIVAHIFHYENPPIRTFTISGSLYFEAIMNVTNELYEELTEM